MFFLFSLQDLMSSTFTLHISIKQSVYDILGIL